LQVCSHGGFLLEWSIIESATARYACRLMDS
jgi:hypothetical protein